ncbi:MAG: hypothetical protein U9Q07_14355 [Planctomycetota bacterium]|nr:hypothetical protein [Planctomycetota bacterium]
MRNRETKEPFRKHTEKYSHNVITEIDFIVDSIDEALKIADNEVTA